MKKIMQKMLGVVCLMTLCASCTNWDVEFDDFDYTAVYFPWQYPVRTLILGDYDYDNSGDKLGQFVISAAMGGVYENTRDRTVEFVVDESLTENVRFSGTETDIKALPSAYYTLSDEKYITIEKGSVSGGVTVQLTDAFFEDPLAISNNYVVPLRIVAADADSIIVGDAAVDDADCRDATQWDVAPMDFTLFGIKYINEYHGSYLLRGASIAKDLSGAPVDTSLYSTDYVETDIVTSLATSGRYTLSYTQPVRVATGTSPGNFTVQITVDDDYNCTIVKDETSDFEVSGTGTYVLNGDTWGGKDRHVFHLAYVVTTDANTYAVNDTLVFRDNGVAVEEFTPEVY